jgi:hypothetical protein
MKFFRTMLFSSLAFPFGINEGAFASEAWATNVTRDDDGRSMAPMRQYEVDYLNSLEISFHYYITDKPIGARWFKINEDGEDTIANALARAFPNGPNDGIVIAPTEVAVAPEIPVVTASPEPAAAATHSEPMPLPDPVVTLSEPLPLPVACVAPDVAIASEPEPPVTNRISDDTGVSLTPVRQYEADFLNSMEVSYSKYYITDKPIGARSFKINQDDGSDPIADILARAFPNGPNASATSPSFIARIASSPEAQRLLQFVTTYEPVAVVTDNEPLPLPATGTIEPAIALQSEPEPLATNKISDDTGVSLTPVRQYEADFLNSMEVSYSKYYVTDEPIGARSFKVNQDDGSDPIADLLARAFPNGPNAPLGSAPSVDSSAATSVIPPSTSPSPEPVVSNCAPNGAANSQPVSTSPAPAMSANAALAAWSPGELPVVTTARPVEEMRPTNELPPEYFVADGAPASVERTGGEVNNGFLIPMRQYEVDYLRRMQIAHRWDEIDYMRRLGVDFDAFYITDRAIGNRWFKISEDGEDKIAELLAQAFARDRFGRFNCGTLGENISGYEDIDAVFVNGIAYVRTNRDVSQSYGGPDADIFDAYRHTILYDYTYGYLMPAEMAYKLSIRQGQRNKRKFDFGSLIPNFVISIATAGFGAAFNIANVAITGTTAIDAAIKSGLSGALSSGLQGGNPVQGFLGGAVGGALNLVDLPSTNIPGVDSVIRSGVGGALVAGAQGRDPLNGLVNGLVSGAIANVDLPSTDNGPLDATLVSAIRGGASGAITAIRGGDLASGLVSGAVGSITGQLGSLVADPATRVSTGAIANSRIENNATAPSDTDTAVATGYELVTVTATEIDAPSTNISPASDPGIEDMPTDPASVGTVISTQPTVVNESDNSRSVQQVVMDLPAEKLKEINLLPEQYAQLRDHANSEGAEALISRRILGDFTTQAREAAVRVNPTYDGVVMGGASGMLVRGVVDGEERVLVTTATHAVSAFTDAQGIPVPFTDTAGNPAELGERLKFTFTTHDGRTYELPAGTRIISTGDNFVGVLDRQTAREILEGKPVRTLPILSTTAPPDNVPVAFVGYPGYTNQAGSIRAGGADTRSLMISEMTVLTAQSDGAVTVVTGMQIASTENYPIYFGVSGGGVVAVSSGELTYYGNIAKMEPSEVSRAMIIDAVAPSHLSVPSGDPVEGSVNGALNAAVGAQNGTTVWFPVDSDAHGIDPDDIAEVTVGQTTQLPTFDELLSWDEATTIVPEALADEPGATENWNDAWESLAETQVGTGDESLKAVLTDGNTMATIMSFAMRLLEMQDQGSVMPAADNEVKIRGWMEAIVRGVTERVNNDFNELFSMPKMESFKLALADLQRIADDPAFAASQAGQDFMRSMSALVEGMRNFSAANGDKKAEYIGAGLYELVKGVAITRSLQSSSSLLIGSPRVFIGEGSFALVYREGDDAIKMIKRVVAGVEDLPNGGFRTVKIPLTNAERSLMSSLVVENTNIVADALSTVPRMHLVRPGVMSQPFVEGLTFEQVRLVSVQSLDRAMAQMEAAQVRAARALGLDPQVRLGDFPNGWKIRVDHQRSNFRFDRDGNVTFWFDPVAIVPAKPVRTLLNRG